MRPPSREQVRKAAQVFHEPQYLRINARRLEHLASLRLPLAGASVLELGAGIGDHSLFYLDRGCRVTALEARAENCQIYQQHLMRVQTYDEDARVRLIQADVEALDAAVAGSFEIVHCYGLLYHLADPAPVLAALAARCTRLLLLETCVSYGEHEALNPVREAASNPSMAVHGQGCRPTRAWILARLRACFPYVYLPLTQPAHIEFPLDWRQPSARFTPDPCSDQPVSRAIFIAAREPLVNELLTEDLPETQRIC